MPGHYERRESVSARWCANIAAVAVPYFAIVILLHRFGNITTPQAFWAIGFGLLLILFSLFLGVRAFLDLWNRGFRGGTATVRGVALSILMLLPFIWFGYLAVKHPLLHDVTTNPFAPPPFIQADDLRTEMAEDGINQLARYDDAYAELLISSFPRLGSRRYNAGAERIYAAARNLIADRRWDVVASIGLPADEGTEQAEGAEASGESEGEAGQMETALPLDIRVEAVARSMIFAFPYDVMLQIVSEEEATLVDMRVVSRWGAHDFGTSAAIIERFLADLDSALLGIAGEG